MSELEDLDFPFYLMTPDILGVLNSTSKNLIISLEVKYHSVPHLKALKNGIEHASGQRNGSTFACTFSGWKCSQEITSKKCKSIQNDCPQVHMLYHTN